MRNLPLKHIPNSPEAMARLLSLMVCLSLGCGIPHCRSNTSTPP